MHMSMPTLRRAATTVVTAMIATVIGVAVSSEPAAASCATNVYIDSWENGKAVSVEVNYTGAFYGMLRARGNSIGPWEKFTRCDYGSYVTLKSNANGKYVHVNTSAESGGSYAYMLRASASSVLGPNEKLRKETLTGFHFALAALSNNKYVTVEMNYTGSTQYMLRARATSVGDWETFFNW